MLKRALVGLVVAVSLLAAPAAAPALTPRLGDWEGVATHGVPISFVLGRHHGRIVLSDLVVGLPSACYGPSTAWQAEPFKAVYVGPGVGVPVRPAGTMTLEVHLSYSLIPLPISGPLRSNHLAVLSMALNPTSVRRCGWPSRLTWRVHPAHRVRVADGIWRGQVAAPGAGSAALSFKVIARGRIIDAMSLIVACSGGGNGRFSGGPGMGEFIAADGSFSGLGRQWYGRFHAGTATGMSFDPGACTGTSTVMSPFALKLAGT